MEYIVMILAGTVGTLLSLGILKIRWFLEDKRSHE